MFLITDLKVTSIEYLVRGLEKKLLIIFFFFSGVCVCVLVVVKLEFEALAKTMITQ